jgi:ATP-binding cassette, subfamily F, member 3
VLFRDVSLRLSDGRRVALIGGNGAGKTTLIEILLGIQEPDSGEIHVPKDQRVGYLPQDLEAASDRLIIDEVMSGSDHIMEVHQSLERLEGRLGDVDAPDYADVIDRYGALQSRFEQLGGYALEAEAHRVLAGLGFAPDDAHRPVNEMSGGWRMRVALARLLLSAPDVLILDEPTNHLDVDSVGWLENHLVGYPGAILFVSHDRDFIDAVAERVIEIADETATEYVGGFAEFVVAREDRIAQIEAAAAAQSRQIAHVEQFVERFRYKATKARQVQSRIKTLEKLAAIPVPQKPQLVKKFGFPEPRRSSRVVVELDGVDAGYDGEVVVRDVSLAIERGQKVAIIGPNGAGKTTLLKVMLGELEPMVGTVEIGNNVDIASFNQHQAEILRQEKTVYEEFSGSVLEPGKRNLRTVLGSFGFSGDAAERQILELSGGEQTRLSLAMALVNPVNLLVLDEPTNHLDLPSCDVLEDALTAYPGTVLLVTHDRHLIRSVADALIEVRNGRARWHDGVSDEMLMPTGETSRRLTSIPTQKSSTSQPSKADKRKTGAAERQRSSDLRKAVNQAERAIQMAETRAAEIEAQLADPALYDDAAKVRTLADELDAAKAEAATHLAAWESASLELESLD